MGLEEIIDKIESDAEKKIEEIKRDREKEIREIEENAQKEAREISGEILQKAEFELKEDRKAALIRANLEIKKETLGKKQELLQSTFREALKKLVQLNREEYIELIEKLLLKFAKYPDAEVHFSSRDKEKLGPHFAAQKKRLFQSEKGRGIKFFYDADDTGGGFVVKKERQEINCTFPRLLDSFHDEMEIEVAGILFR